MHARERAERRARYLESQKSGRSNVSTIYNDLLEGIYFRRYARMKYEGLGLRRRLRAQTNATKPEYGAV